MRRIFPDYAATRSLLPEVFETMKPYYFDYYDNPSSLYDLGFKAKSGIENSRKIIADLLDKDKDDIIFTYYGTELNKPANESVPKPINFQKLGEVIQESEEKNGAKIFWIKKN